MILPETDLGEALEIAEKLRKKIEHCLFRCQGKRVPVTLSCGLAKFRNNDDPESVFVRADKALYAAKNNGRNCCMTEKNRDLKLVANG